MILSSPTHGRELRTDELSAELVVVGGGLAGLCAATTAARAGLSVILVQDRPVLGGNASSEVRLWILGATSHMGNNNRWSREGGIVDEILIENAYRNPEGNPLILDSILLEKAVAEPNLKLLLNTAVYEVENESTGRIRQVTAFCSQNSTRYILRAPLFVDASGDGIVGFLAGGAFRMGAESRDEFQEQFAPAAAYGELLGHSLYFYTRDTGRPVRFVPPAFALQDITTIPRWKAFNSREHGCQLWWIEYGGRLDTVHQTEEIKWELWKIIYGVWNHIKNSGEFPKSETLTLEWVGHIPGKRESRRFEGDYLLSQRDLVEQRKHPDAISYGGWAIDLHPADGVYSSLPGCQQYHSKGVYQIPYRCYYSRNIDNLFLAGRIISATHVAFGSTRVMATCAHGGQAVGMAAALCREFQCAPRDLLQAGRLSVLQRRLSRIGHSLPGVDVEDPDDLATSATVTASSELSLAELPAGSEWTDLAEPRAMLFPVSVGEFPRLKFRMRASHPSPLRVELRVCSRQGSFTPDLTLATREFTVEPLNRDALSSNGISAACVAHAPLQGTASSTIAVASRSTAIVDDPKAGDVIEVDFGIQMENETYVTVCLFGTPEIKVALSDLRVSGILSLSHRANSKVATQAVQRPPADSGLDELEFWLPERRPKGKNLALQFDPPLNLFDARRLAYGAERPTTSANCWAAEIDDLRPWVEFAWPREQSIGSATICLDNDFDHPLESVLMGNPEPVMPFCLPEITATTADGRVLARATENHLTRVTFRWDPPVCTRGLRFQFARNDSGAPAAVFRIRLHGAEHS
ncbi:FAD-dependent oxidoreductase [Planctomicrobium sp. SH664]|uniref:FAD-dependent oxidoreductase n=1 Tax=Planctomicrobium sp. SH664 TaxID=3448125 RepID=UPI003F5C8167